MYEGNRYNPETGIVTGDHLRHTAGIGIHKLVDRANHQTLGCDRKLSQDDMPGKVRDLITQAERLAEQIRLCDNIPIAVAADYIRSQAKIAGEALPLLLLEKERREQAARDAQATLRAQLIGKGNSLVAAGVDILMRDIDIPGAISIEAQLTAWRAAFAICRDVAACRSTPRWLAVMIAAHEAHTKLAAVR